MGFPTKILLINRAGSGQWYINFPSAVAQAMEFDKGEIAGWIIEDKQKMILKRSLTYKDREQKTILGCGQAQVRTARSAQDVPAFITAIYALLHIANHRSSKIPDQKILPGPKWDTNKNSSRTTTGDLINNLRAQLWAKAVGISFSG